MSRRSRLGSLLLLACLALACSEESAENSDPGALSKGGTGGSGAGGNATAGNGGSGGGGVNVGNGGAKTSAVVLELKLESEPWNVNNVETGEVHAVLEFEGRTVLFGSLGVQVLAGGAVAAHDESLKSWRSASIFPAADGPGSWVVGLDSDGKLHRLADLESLEPISDRYGLEDEEILSVAADTSLVFALKTGIAVAEGGQVTRYDLGAVSSVVTRGAWAAALLADRVTLFDLEKKQEVSFPVAGARAVALDGKGRLVVTTEKALMAQGEPGASVALQEVYQGANLGTLVPSGGRLWFTTGSEIGTFEPGIVSLSSGLKLPEQLVLLPSSSGGVWTAGAGMPLRFSLGGASEDEKQWQATVQPAFARSCSACHLPGGSGGRDLSTYKAWSTFRDKINTRVVVQKNMPPAGAPLSQEDLDAITAWCASSP